MNARHAACPQCDVRVVPRREFLQVAGRSALALGAASRLAPLGHAAEAAGIVRHPRQQEG